VGWILASLRWTAWMHRLFSFPFSVLHWVHAAGRGFCYPKKRNFLKKFFGVGYPPEAYFFFCLRRHTFLSSDRKVCKRADQRGRANCRQRKMLHILLPATPFPFGIPIPLNKPPQRVPCEPTWQTCTTDRIVKMRLRRETIEGACALFIFAIVLFLPALPRSLSRYLLRWLH